MGEADTPGEVARRLGRPFDEVREQLEELFGQDWDEIEIVIETAASKRGTSRADVIVDLVGKAERKPGASARIRRSVIRWIGKPWRERANPWERFAERLPPAPPRITESSSDLDEWTPLRPDEESE